MSILLEGVLRIAGSLFFRRSVLFLGTGGIRCHLGGKRYFIESPSAFYDSKQVVIHSDRIFLLRNGNRQPVGEGTRYKVLSFLREWSRRKGIEIVVR